MCVNKAEVIRKKLNYKSGKVACTYYIYLTFQFTEIKITILLLILTNKKHDDPRTSDVSSVSCREKNSPSADFHD